MKNTKRTKFTAKAFTGAVQAAWINPAGGLAYAIADGRTWWVTPTTGFDGFARPMAEAELTAAGWRRLEGRLSIEAAPMGHYMLLVDGRSPWARR